MAHAMGWITVLSYAVLIAFPGNQVSEVRYQGSDGVLVWILVFFF